MGKRHYALILAALVAAVSALSGCVTTGPVAAGGGGESAKEAHSTSGAGAAKELAVARRMVKGGQYSLVIPRLQQIATRYPGDKSGVEARHLLGVAYYKVGEYNQSLENFNQYVALSPDGEYAEDSREYISRLTAERSTQGLPPEAEAKIAEYKGQYAASPDNMSLGLQLANLYWDTGRYAEAGGVYRELLGRWPQLKDDTVIRTRMSRGNDGTWTVLDPAEAERRFREADPLAIFNVAAFRSGRFEGWPAVATQRYYNVAGQAANRGSSQLADVSVIVTIYGFGQMVYDTQTVSLGTLQPGEVRAFSAQFSRFDDINNVVRHECLGTFRR